MLKRGRPAASWPARDPPHGGLERARKTQRGRARAAQRPILSPTDRPGNGGGVCVGAGRERGVGEGDGYGGREERPTPAVRSAVEWE